MNDAFEWTLQPREGWEAIRPFAVGGNQPQFVSAEQHEDRILHRYFWDEASKSIYAFVRLGVGAQGPPGKAHGGALAAILDEAMGMVAWRQKISVVAAELRVRYRLPTPLWEELIVRSWIEESEGRNSEIRSEITLADGTVCVQGGGTFVNIGKERYQQMAREADAKRGKAPA